MNKLIGNCIIAQSGGPTSVINASAYGVIREFLDTDSSIKVYAGTHGVQGILDRRLVDVAGINPSTIDHLKFLPSAAFGSCRYKLLDNIGNDGDYKKLLEIFKEYNIRYFFYNGGNDSMDSAAKVNRFAQSIGYEMRVVGVPKTIDNDLIETDHCPGFGSSAKYIANSVLEVWYDICSYSKKQITVIEAMGRDAGWLAASASLVGDNVNKLIYLPENNFDDDRFLANVEEAMKKDKRLIIVASEGIHYGDGNYVSVDNARDSFGHAKLGGAARALKKMLLANFAVDVRAIELGLLQRCAMHCVSGNDLNESEMVGRGAAKLAISGETGCMAAFDRVSEDPYRCEVKSVPLDDVCNKVKNVPKDWIGEDLCSVTQDYIRYAAPLIAGKADVYGDDGLIHNVNIRLFR